jgi:hypothetical protein
MKQFDLEAAKRGEPLVTRDGRKVIHFHHIETDESRLCCVVHVEGHAGAGWVPKDGRYSEVVDGPDDLFMAPKTRTVFVQIFNKETDGKSPALRAVAFENKGDAESNLKTTAWPVLAVAVPVEIEE